MHGLISRDASRMAHFITYMQDVPRTWSHLSPELVKRLQGVSGQGRALSLAKMLSLVERLRQVTLLWPAKRW